MSKDSVQGDLMMKRDAGCDETMGNTHRGPAGSGSLNTITPCAACKLLRRRCAEECPFSPYFSPHEPHKFAAVHKVFGASNVSKMLMEVAESQRPDAANSLVYEANLRLRDPVYGSMGAIVTLQQQKQTLQAQLNAVRAEIHKYKIREATNTNNNTTTPIIISPSIAAPSTSLPPTPPRSTVVSSSSLYTPPTTAAAYTSISTDNVPYLD